VYIIAWGVVGVMEEAWVWFAGESGGKHDAFPDSGDRGAVF